MKINTSKLLILLCLSSAIPLTLRAGPSEADVGDPDSFRHDALYLGTASGIVAISSDCSTQPPGTQCVTANPAPAATDLDDEDVCHIILPKGATKDIIYPVVSFFQSYTFENNTGTQQQALLLYTASITIDSAALNDPNCIDPMTGTQCNGHLVMQYSDNAYTDRRDHFAAGDKTLNRQNYSHVGNLGITKRKLVETGLPQNIADKLFANAMTVHLTIQMTSQMASSVRIVGNMRLFGD